MPELSPEDAFYEAGRIANIRQWKGRRPGDADTEVA
jgi:hypothetical protein